jgi:hypothetical protein
VALLFLVSGPASAQQGVIEGLRTILDTNISTISTTTTDGSGTATTVRTNTFYPRLTLTTDTLLYPNLRLNAGGVFEYDKLFAPDAAGGTDVTITRLRPFFELRSTNPMFAPGISYFRRENLTKIQDQPLLKLVNEDYTAYLGWKPEGLPLFDFQFMRTNTFNGERTFLDTTRDLGQVLARYGYRNLNLYYQGFRLDTTDRVYDVDTRQVSHSARADYSSGFFHDRLQWGATYNIDRQDLTTVASGEGGEVAVPVIPFAGLAVLSDTPLTAALSPNPALIDANLTASAGIDLGLPAPGADSQARNLGFDFLGPTEVNRLLVWIDRDLPADIAGSFSWEIYSSPDNLIWRRETVVPAAPFGPFETRFQVDFPAVTARYLKVVTRPLSSAVLNASNYPDIFVTEMQAFLTKPAGELRGKLVRTTQNINTDVRLRILDTPSLYYEGSYWYNGVDPSGSDASSAIQDTVYRDTLSNGLSVNQRFNRVFAAYARGAYEQGTQPEGDRTATVSNATLTIDPVRTFTTSLLYTGLDEQIADREEARRSFSVQTNTQLYRGIDVQFGFGWNFTTRDTGEDTRDRYVNLTASFVPRRNVTLTVNYVGTTTTRSGVFFGDPQYYTRRGYVTLAFDPVRTLHVVLEEDVLAVTDEKTRATTDIGVNWSPFPDGSLQFIVAYNNALRSLEFGRERDFRTGVRWMITRRSYVDVSYYRTKSEFVQLETESKVFSVDLRLFF